MPGLKCTIKVMAGLIPGQPLANYTREWHFTQEDMDNPPKYIDDTGAAMNYAMSLQRPDILNWVRMDWIWC